MTSIVNLLAKDLSVDTVLDAINKAFCTSCPFHVACPECRGKGVLHLIQKDGAMHRWKCDTCGNIERTYG